MPLTGSALRAELRECIHAGEEARHADRVRREAARLRAVPDQQEPEALFGRDLRTGEE